MTLSTVFPVDLHCPVICFNTVGHVQSRQSIEEVIQFAAEEKLFLLVDEVNDNFQIDPNAPFGASLHYLQYKFALC